MEILKNDTDYAMRALVYLAQHQKEWPIAVKVLASKQDIPDTFAYKILQRLTKAGLTRAHMGPHGGFVLAREPEEITLLKVVEAIQGALIVRKCLLDTGGCARRSSCPVSVKLGQIQNGLAKVLESVTLANVLEDVFGQQDCAGGNCL